ncbi:hypothetical protein A3K93_08135 [Acinetobacter sp. NCu2D-2]|uniref:hypothetical protein n=1 Tax=Acinetobacter sp. NCu2D-2 TaxID=1608473 RepID=UPI0007CE08E9|nr:hypothetical protein [Acinetobacter sp. NCu2D-2]ANF82163.1 hypothetical protein A3K93_08135 [Acinetobacter sp. NCu2D-2]
MKHLLFSACIALLAMNSSAKDVWECGNAVLQDLCQNQQCRGKGPAHLDRLTISVQGQKNVSICTNQACWRGQAMVTNQNAQLILKLNDVRWQDRDYPDPKKTYVLSINRSTQSIYFEGNNENHPVACKAV